jgi:tRNA threonylcarbamoyl adenosine modification protein YeaZ
MGLVLAFDATHVATVAVSTARICRRRTTRAYRVLADAQILGAAGAGPADVDALVVGTGPGSFTGLRLGLAAAQGFALAREVPATGVSTLDALAAGAPGAEPVVDGGRREIFAFVDAEPRSLQAGDLVFEPGTTLVGDGALRYRAVSGARCGRPPGRRRCPRPTRAASRQTGLGRRRLRPCGADRACLRP